MIAQGSHNSQAKELIYTPPDLPAHIAAAYNLKPIVGHPKEDDVKLIHAAIRAVNTEARVPRLYNPDLLLQLSQHLFSIQLAGYQDRYPLLLSSAHNIYTPPSVPTHISTSELEPVTGAPSDEELKAAQNVMRVAENLVTSPLFDSDLNMHLSQHLFNLQFARCIRDSALGRYVSTPRESRRAPTAIDSPTAHDNPDAPTQPDPAQTNTPEAEPGNTEQPAHPGIAQLEGGVTDMKGLMNESKGLLENINRVLIAIQRNQVTIGEWTDHNLAHVNPVNDQGVTAAECGLPQLRFTYHKGNYWNHLNPAGLAAYLNFFRIGADLLEGGAKPQIKSGREPEARELIFKHIGMFSQL